MVYETGKGHIQIIEVNGTLKVKKTMKEYLIDFTRKGGRTAVVLMTMLCTFCQSISAQRITRQYDNVAFSAALKDLNQAQDKYDINFVYNELEDFKVSKSIRNLNVPDAIMQLIGFYPIKMKQVGNVIIVECIQKTPTKMIGRVVDTRHQPVDLANVALLNVRDSSFITGGVTNENGQFVIPCETKKAIVKVSCMGYNTYCNIYNTGRIGTITLNEATITLQKVVVKGHRKIYKTDGTRLVVDIQKSVLSDMGSADDIVAQLPMVSGGEGNYSVFGRGSADVYINNRKVRDKSELSRLNSKDISTIEVINNPGVEYDADTHAVIKINLKHKVEGGFGGRASVFGSQGRKSSDSEQLQLTYDSHAVNVFLSFANSSNRYKTDQANTEQTIVNGATWNMESDMPKWNSNYYNQTINAGISTELAENHTIGASLAYSKETDRWGGVSTSRMFNNKQLFEDLFSDSRSHANYDQWIANIFYDGALSQKWKIALNADYVNREAADNRLNQESGSMTVQHEVRNENETSHSIYAGNIKISYQANRNLAFNVGADASYVDEKKDFLSYENEEFGSSSRFHAEETKLAAFAGCHFSIDKLSAQLGMRFETFSLLYRDAASQKSLADKTQRHFYPFISLSLPIKHVEMGLSMTTKVKRPSYYELRNSEEYFNRYSIESGNPWLLPQYTTDVSYSLQWNQLRFSVDYQRIKDYIISTNIIRQAEPLVAVSRPDNFSHYSAVNASLAYHTNVGVWEPYLNLNMMRTYLSLYNSDGSKVNNNKPYLSMSFNNYFNLHHHWMPYLQISYNSDGNMREYRVRQALWVSLGVTKHFADNAWLVRLSVNNIFGTKEREIRYASDYIFDKSSFKDSRRFSLWVRYTFKDKKRYKGESAASEEMGRL